MTRSGGGDRGRHQSGRSSGQGGYAFGPFVVDPLKRRLWREGRLVPITSKTFDVLVVLLEQRDHTVSKDELLNRVWPDTAVNENNLARQISSLRRALGQRPDQHDFVVTIPGHGYRFVATVQDLPDVPPELPRPPRQCSVPTAISIGMWRRSQRWMSPIIAPPMSFRQPSRSQESARRRRRPSGVIDQTEPAVDVSSEHSSPRAAGSLPRAVAVTLLRPASPQSAASTNPAAHHL